MNDDEAAVYEFCIQLHRTRKVDDATFNRARDSGYLLRTHREALSFDVPPL